MVAWVTGVFVDGSGDPLTQLEQGEPVAVAVATSPATVPTALELRLWERLRDAEPAAIDEAYRAHHSVLRGYAQRLIGEPAAAEDLVHDVFVSLPKLLRGFRGESSLRSFLLGVTTQLATRYVRKTRRRRALLARFGERDRSDTANPEQALARDQDWQRLYRALDVLSMEQRAAFVLCEIEERSAAEAAEIVRAPEATVRTRCFHARKRLQQHLQRSRR